MNESKYRAEYSNLSDSELQSEKAKQQNIIEVETNNWRQTSLGGPIVMAVFGLFFCWVLIGIPLLVLGIYYIVTRAKERNRCNQAIYQARDRIAVIDLILQERGSIYTAPEAEVEDVDDTAADNI